MSTTHDAGRMAGQVAIVTGGTRGIGLSIAEAMLREGASVIVASRKQAGVDAAIAHLQAAVPGRAESVGGVAAHVGQASDCEALVAFATERFGPPDVLVNNAGTNPFFGPTLQITEEAFDKTFEVNLKSAWRLSVLVARQLIAAGRGGSIINISSVLGMRAAPFQGAYGMTKAALIAMTQTLAIELGGAGIRVNAVSPGLVETRLASAITSNDALTSAFTARAGIKRAGQPAEIAPAAVFLACPESSYLTGVVLPVDGGFVAA